VTGNGFGPGAVAVLVLVKWASEDHRFEHNRRAIADVPMV
jgi:hypothetical protein